MNACRERKPEARSRKESTEGFTLIEIMITVGVASLVIASIIAALVFNSYYSRMQELHSKAMNLAARTVEDLRRTPFNQLQGYTQDVVIDDNRTPDNSADDVSGVLTVEYRSKHGVPLASPPTTDDRVDVVVTVAWSGAGRLSGRTYKQSLVTYFVPLR